MGGLHVRTVCKVLFFTCSEKDKYFCGCCLRICARQLSKHAGELAEHIQLPIFFGHGRTFGFSQPTYCPGNNCSISVQNTVRFHIDSLGSSNWNRAADTHWKSEKLISILIARIK